jgi:hypothetical protein
MQKHFRANTSCSNAGQCLISCLHLSWLLTADQHHTLFHVLKVGKGKGERTTCASTASSLNLRRANALTQSRRCFGTSPVAKYQSVIELRMTQDCQLHPPAAIQDMELTLIERSHTPPCTWCCTKTMNVSWHVHGLPVSQCRQ